MESKTDNVERMQSDFFSPLLPNYFKKIGISILILAFLPGIILKLSIIELAVEQKETLKYVCTNFFILGMLLIAWAKNKVEDELTIALRIKSMMLAFLLGVFAVVLKPLSDLLLGLKIADMTAQDDIIGMLFFYFIFYYLQRKRK